jgi:hypothetical protein
MVWQISNHKKNGITRHSRDSEKWGKAQKKPEFSLSIPFYLREKSGKLFN